MTRKISLVGLALVAMCAFSALATSPAFAALEFTLGEWLVGGAAVTTAVPADTLGELLFENTSLKGAILCSGLFEGTVGPNGEDEITMVFNLAGELIEELDASTATKGLACVEDEKKMCNDGEIWPVNLPFLTLLELDTSEALWYDLVVPNAAGLLPAYWVRCLAIITVEELCVAANGSGGLVQNVAGGVEPVGAIEPLGECKGTAGIGLIEADTGGLTTATGGLTVSE